MLFAFRNTKKRWWCALCSNTREYMYYLLYFISFVKKVWKRKTIQIPLGKSNPNIRISDFVLQSSVMKPQKLAMELFWLRSDWKTGFSLMHFLFVERCSLKIKSNLYELVWLSVLSESRSFKGVVCICIYIITMDMYCSLDVFFIHD